MYSEHYPIYTPLLSEGLGEASSLPLRGGSGWGFTPRSVVPLL